jgi:adenosylcobinamide-GDP ribazoletransferase
MTAPPELDRPVQASAPLKRESPLIPLAAALQLLTIIPPLVRRMFTDREMGRAVSWFPLVGALLGTGLAALDATCRLIVPVPVAAALVLAAWIVATGALHLDGFLDACDGLLGGHTPEDRLRIFRDERVGAFAVIGGVLLMLLKYSVLIGLEHRAAALIVVPTLGRWLIALAVVRYPYARPQGLGRALHDHAGVRQAWAATITAVTIAVLLGRETGFVCLLASLAVGAWVVWFTLRRLPGLTGDIYGALCEVGETATLVVWTACEHLAR